MRSDTMSPSSPRFTTSIESLSYPLQSETGDFSVKAGHSYIPFSHAGAARKKELRPLEAHMFVTPNL